MYTAFIDSEGFISCRARRKIRRSSPILHT